MNDSTFSSDARRRLWQCYALLLQLADEADPDTSKKHLEAEAKTRQVEKSDQPNTDSIAMETQIIGG